MNGASDWVIAISSAPAGTEQSLEMAVDEPPDIGVKQDCEEDNSDSPAVGEAISKIGTFRSDPAPVPADRSHHIE